MVLTVDFNGDEAICVRLRNQIVLEIAMERIREGDFLPFIRQLADNTGISIHAVNKAYSVLRQEGFMKLDRRRGTIVCLDVDKLQTLEEMRQRLTVVLATDICKDIGREEVHQIVDEIYNIFQNGGR